jgi:hypothetical protein
MSAALRGPSEDSMWENIRSIEESIIRSIEESAILMQHLVRHLRANGLDDLAEPLFLKAQEAERCIEAMRQAHALRRSR